MKLTHLQTAGIATVKSIDFKSSPAPVSCCPCHDFPASPSQRTVAGYPLAESTVEGCATQCSWAACKPYLLMWSAVYLRLCTQACTVDHGRQCFRVHRTPLLRP